jgi:cysteinyl-tRNA synthetase
MSMKILGTSFDLHLGGEDLMFPHHEDEIAQSEGAGVQPAGQRFVKYWLHGAHLLVEGKKMSKSLGNFFTLRDLIARGFTGPEIRRLLLSAHYRETFNFTLEGLQDARQSLARIGECLGKLNEVARGHQNAPNLKILTSFAEALDDDLNVSAAWGIIFDWVRQTNKMIASDKLDPSDAAASLATWRKINSVFGLVFRNQIHVTVTDQSSDVGLPPGDVILVPDVNVPSEIAPLIAARIEARAAKDFKRSDAIRDELKAKGWVIEDTPKGSKLRKI